MQTCPTDMCQDPPRSGILDPQDPGSDILEDLGSYIFLFSRDPILSRQYNHGILGILDLGQKRSCWILDPTLASYRGISQILDLTQQYATAPLRPFTSNKTLLLVPHIYALLKLQHCLDFQPHMDSTILCWLENRLTLLVPPHVFYYRGVVNRMWKKEMNAHFISHHYIRNDDLDIKNSFI